MAKGGCRAFVAERWMNNPGGFGVGRGVRAADGTAVWFGIAALGVLLSSGAIWWGCRRDRASVAQVRAARKVARGYLDAWTREDWRRMYELSTRQRILHLTDLDPGKGSEFDRRAFERFALVAEQAKRYMGYERFEIEKVAASRKGQVVFVIKARSEDGRVSEILLRLVRRNRAWRVD